MVSVYRAGCLLGAGLIAWSPAAHAETYYGPLWNADRSATGWGVAGGSLELSHDSTSVYGKYYRGAGSLNDVVVFYLDTRPGGFNSTVNFYDHGDYYRRAIALVSQDGQLRCQADFVPGFGADYAIAMGPDLNGGRLFELAGGAGATFSPGPDDDQISVGLNPSGEPYANYFTFSFSWASIGLDLAPEKGFRFETLHSTRTGYASPDSLQEVEGVEGWGNTITFSSVGTYGTVAVPEPGGAVLALLGLGGWMVRRRL